jgi:hypothetical protein
MAGTNTNACTATFNAQEAHAAAADISTPDSAHGIKHDLQATGIHGVGG